MKTSDIAMIILIASLSVMVSFFVVNSLPFFTISEADITVPEIESIEPTIADPDVTVFNGEAINPTVQVLIGGDNDPRSSE